MPHASVNMTALTSTRRLKIDILIQLNIEVLNGRFVMLVCTYAWRLGLRSIGQTGPIEVEFLRGVEQHDCEGKESMSQSCEYVQYTGIEQHSLPTINCAAIDQSVIIDCCTNKSREWCKQML